MKALRIIPLAVLGVMFLGLVWALVLQTRDGTELPRLDRPVPAFSLPALETRPGGGDTSGLQTADILAADGPVLVNVWASHCAPCMVEHPVLERLAAAGVPIHGINYNDTPDKAAAFLKRMGDPFQNIGVDPDGRAAVEWGVTGMPETFAIDAEGRIRGHYRGALTPEIARALLRLAEGGGKTGPQAPARPATS